MEEDPWRFYSAIRPILVKCMADKQQLSETYNLIHNNGLMSPWYQDSIKKRVEYDGVMYGDSCPFEEIFLLTELEVSMKRAPNKMLHIIDTLLYSIIGDTLRKVLQNLFWRLFDFSFDPDLSWLEDLGLPWVAKYQLEMYMELYIGKFKRTWL
jgi:hypothetical protein